MDLELTGKRAIVSGGSRGIGLAVARALAAEGSHVALVARGAAVLAAARKAVDAVPSAAGSGRRVIAVGCDTGDDEAVRDMMAAVVDGLGGVDILVNAAARPKSSRQTTRRRGHRPIADACRPLASTLGHAHGAGSLVPLSTGASAESDERRSSRKPAFVWPTSIRWPSGSRK
jgi:NAD(P)-dependent dehydrogenase (short-subunit alcohol dehydrogenase family)